MTRSRNQKLIALAALCLLVFCKSRPVPERWKILGIPVSEISEVHEDSNPHVLHVNFKDRDEARIERMLAENLAKSNYQKTCDEIHGRIKGFTDGKDPLVMKFDLGENVELTVGDSKGQQDIYFGLCFKGYKAKRLYCSGPDCPREESDSVK